MGAFIPHPGFRVLDGWSAGSHADAGRSFAGAFSRRTPGPGTPGEKIAEGGGAPWGGGHGNCGHHRCLDPARLPPPRLAARQVVFGGNSYWIGLNGYSAHAGVPCGKNRASAPGNENFARPYLFGFYWNSGSGDDQTFLRPILDEHNRRNRMAVKITAAKNGPLRIE